MTFPSLYSRADPSPPPLPPPPSHLFPSESLADHSGIFINLHISSSGSVAGPDRGTCVHSLMREVLLVCKQGATMHFCVLLCNNMHAWREYEDQFYTYCKFIIHVQKSSDNPVVASSRCQLMCSKWKPIYPVLSKPSSLLIHAYTAHNITQRYESVNTFPSAS